MFISADELVGLLTKSENHVLVIDVREQDREGGHIRKSVNCPAFAFGDHTCRDILQLAKIQSKKYIVFHCAYSQQRGPTCARYFMNYCKAHQELTDGSIDCFILERGMNGFKAQYRGTEWIEGCDDL
jgi:Cdc25 family phosphatase